MFETYLTYLNFESDKRERLEVYNDLKHEDKNYALTAAN